MRERLERMLGQTARAIWILTFHAACGRMLRREAQRLGYHVELHDLRRPGSGAARQGVPRGARQGSEAVLAARDPRADLAREERARLPGGRTTARVASFWDQTVAETYELYQRRLHASNAVDFDDMLMLTVQVFERFPEALERWRKAFRYVLVDEYQDTNHAQYRLLQLLGERARKRLRGGRSGPVLARRDAGDDGERLDQADRGCSIGRRGALVLGSGCLRRRSCDARAPLATVSRSRDNDRLGPVRGLDAGASITSRDSRPAGLRSSS